jgi:lipopolysaccharide/colanic/teichoic acid biosynthesis glycosyltransferase
VSTHSRLKPRGYRFKRTLDVVLSLCILAVVWPLMILVAGTVGLALGSPVLFRQPRPGLAGRSFVLCKFRTMRDIIDDSGRPLPDEARLVAVGRFLRATSMDELPQLWNVLRGEMSMVGPRPLLPQYLALYTSEQARRHEVRPGITGWAQVCGRNALSWEEKFELDVWYVDHVSLWLDLRILGLSMWQVLHRRGITQQGHATMPPFTGSSPPSG